MKDSVFSQMFLIIPLILIVGSAWGIGYIFRPKIKELQGKENLPQIEESFWRLMFPEFFNFWDRIDFGGFKKNFLNDYEKFLRRVKILSLKAHNLTDKLLEKKQKAAGKPEFREEVKLINGQKTVNIYFKTKENNLISEIAKNPKDRNLYKTLGALYLENQMYDDAKEVFNVVLELDPNDEEAKGSIEKIGEMA